MQKLMVKEIFMRVFAIYHKNDLKVCMEMDFEWGSKTNLLQL